MARCSENVICRQTNDDSDTSVRDKYIATAILERQENDEFDDANHTREPHRFEPYLDILDQIRRRRRSLVGAAHALQRSRRRSRIQALLL